MRNVVWTAALVLAGSRASEAGAAGGVRAEVSADGAVLANEYLALRWATVGGRVRTVRIENRRSGQALDLAGDDVVIELANGRTIRSDQLRVADVQTLAGQRRRAVVFQLEGEGLRISCRTDLQAGRWWAERRLEIRGPPVGLARVALADWRCQGATGPPDQGQTVGSLGYPSGCGQVVYAGDLFFGIAHPGAENFASADGIRCSIPASGTLSPDRSLITKTLVIGAGPRGDAWRAFVRYLDATRPVPARMVCLVNDWYWKDKSEPLQALRRLAEVKRRSGAPIDSFTLDDGWDFDWDEQTGLWGRLNRTRFPGGWEALQAAGRAADINVSLWFGPIGGYRYRPRRIEYAKQLGLEINGDKLCLCGPRYKRHVIESFSRWARRGMDYIKVDGFWPNCPVAEHGHPVGRGAAIAQMDCLIDVFDAWRRAKPDLLIAYTSGSHPSPFWLRHADFLWRGGRDDSHAGVGAPFDRHNTYLDSILYLHRGTSLPVSALATFDIVQPRVAGSDDRALERGFWWLAARTSLHHDWYVAPDDFTSDQWRMLAAAARWAKRHEQTFRFGRMFGGDPAKGEAYGFSAFDGRRGTLAVRNPTDKPQEMAGTLTDWLALPPAARGRAIRLRGAYGETGELEGVCGAAEAVRVRLGPLAIAVFEVELN